MLPDLEYGQNVFIELTNLIHGGAGWELGQCLWSPHKNKKGGDSWKRMQDVKPGDIIIHFAKIKGHQHWYGISFAQSHLKVTNIVPPIPGDHIGMAPYQRINLSGFERLHKPIPIKNFLKRYRSTLIKLKKKYPKGLFYNVNIENSQKYLAICPKELYSLFNDYSDSINFSPISGYSESIPTVNEPLQSDYSTPTRVSTSILRIIRDTMLVKDLKNTYTYTCQICGHKTLLPNTKYYCEGHHIQPLGGIHGGVDEKSNIILLCPNHHAEFDYGSIAINPSTMKIEHIDKNNPYNNLELNYKRGDIRNEFLEYHYHNIFKK